MINTLYASQQMRQLLVVAFRNCNIPCCSGNPLQPFLPRVQWKHAPGQEQSLGMVKIERIGRSACLLPKQMVGRQRLNGYVLHLHAMLKIQSTPLGKLRGVKVLTAIRYTLSTVLLWYSTL